mmetsp:Transcript_31905/g.87845  ORF Transcript_31905/g.87845 Transcript_31905/m.87845 type:complete len:584 (-) Transcript_31905:250-2001(-)
MDVGQRSAGPGQGCDVALGPLQRLASLPHGALRERAAALARSTAQAVQLRLRGLKPGQGATQLLELQTLRRLQPHLHLHRCRAKPRLHAAHVRGHRRPLLRRRGQPLRLALRVRDGLQDAGQGAPHPQPLLKVPGELAELGHLRLHLLHLSLHVRERVAALLSREASALQRAHLLLLCLELPAREGECVLRLEFHSMRLLQCAPQRRGLCTLQLRTSPAQHEHRAFGFPDFRPDDLSKARLPALCRFSLESLDALQAVVDALPQALELAACGLPGTVRQAPGLYSAQGQVLARLRERCLRGCGGTVHAGEHLVGLFGWHALEPHEEGRLRVPHTFQHSLCSCHALLGLPHQRCCRSARACLFHCLLCLVEQCLGSFSARLQLEHPVAACTFEAGNAARDEAQCWCQIGARSAQRLSGFTCFHLACFFGTRVHGPHQRLCNGSYPLTIHLHNGKPRGQLPKKFLGLQRHFVVPPHTSVFLQFGLRSVQTGQKPGDLFPGTFPHQWGHGLHLAGSCLHLLARLGDGGHRCLHGPLRVADRAELQLPELLRGIHRERSGQDVRPLRFVLRRQDTLLQLRQHSLKPQ